MRVWIGLCVLGGTLLGGTVLGAMSAQAQDAEALRKELEDMCKQFNAMKDSYEKAINNLSERIQAIESRPEPQPNVATPAPASPAPAAPPAAAASQASAGGPPSLLDLAKPREPFSLYQQRGSGQLLFDMGVTGDFVGNLVGATPAVFPPAACRRVQRRQRGGLRQ